MKLPEREWRALYVFALKYAKVCRSHCIEVDEAVNEMMLMVMQMREWKSEEYTKQMMRNHVMDIFRRDKIIHACEHPLEEGEGVGRRESDKWDAKIMVDGLLQRASASQARTLKCLLNGKTINETARTERINRRTISRHLNQARVLMAA